MTDRWREGLAHAVPPSPRQTGVLRRWLRRIALAVLLVPIALVALYAVLPPPGTPLMAMRYFEGETPDAHWVALEAISPHLARAVVAGEDNRFCGHDGFDWIEIEKAVKSWRAGERLRSASTLSQQTSKNLFLWPQQDFVRKGLEAYITLLLELTWSKRRIIEVYLNIAEWGSGIFGAEAASRHYFGKAAASLSAHEAALLAAILPSPRHWSAQSPSAFVRERAETILGRVRQLGSLLACLD